MKKRQFSALEAKTIKALVEIAGNGSYVLSTKDCLKEILIEKEVLKSSQINAVFNNLSAKGLLSSTKDMFDSMIELTFKGKHAYRCILRDEAINA